jgi:CTP synthase
LESLSIKIKNPKSKITIGLVGKYVELQDAYKSILEAFVHAGALNECKVEVKNLHSEYLDEDNVRSSLSGLDGIL